MSIHEQVESFYRFATERLENGGADLSMDELCDEWRIKNPTPEEYAENVAAIQVAIDNLNKGAECRDAKEVIEEIRERLNQPATDPTI